jgi:hypothetical protein
VDEVDRYGGWLTLVDNQQTTALHDGMYVHVRGQLVNASGSGPGQTTYYQVAGLRAVDNPNAVQSPSD